ncbi:MAG TPA: hypothetical protein PKD12_05990, partial [Nitrospira sp.]|nr:hypothetical protein [Nitrospira sp.]
SKRNLCIVASLEFGFMAQVAPQRMSMAHHTPSRSLVEQSPGQLSIKFRRKSTTQSAVFGFFTSALLADASEFSCSTHEWP